VKASNSIKILFYCGEGNGMSLCTAWRHRVEWRFASAHSEPRR